MTIFVSRCICAKSLLQLCVMASLEPPKLQLQNAYLFFGEDANALYAHTETFCRTIQSALTALMTKDESIYQQDPFTILTHSGQHPDFIFESPESVIPIDRIKFIQERIRYGPSHYDHFMVIIDHAHKLTTQAANAFLKTIESPPNGVHFIFLTTAKSKLLPTIYSRCTPLHISSQPHITEPQIALNTLLNQTLHVKYEMLAEILADKAAVQSLLYGWVHTLWQTPEAPIDTGHIDRINIIIECINRLEFNVNIRLQIEALLFRLESLARPNH
jgi:hypothetical protein